ncbi:MAG: PD-(D/E)XK nuclease family protein [Bacteroidales bacterium]|nr:PD-(D/E)XK nuclease family protein [Bacteroidales bacterium]
METFLEKTAQYVVAKYGDNLRNLCIVLPNRRASLFLKKALSKNIAKPVWSPEILAVEDFVYKSTGLLPADNMFLLFDLYEIYRDSTKEAIADFDEFIGWGEVVLNDFNDVDLYLADTRQLFTYLSDVKAIGLWNPDGKPLTPFQQNYLRFFNSLEGLYSNLKERLLNSGQAYQGLAYRELVHALENNPLLVPYQQVIFAGFNALTPAESAIFSLLEKAGKADVLWDADRYYIDQPEQEAGFFLRNVFKTNEENRPNWLFDNFRSASKSIRIIGVPQKVGQVKTAGNIIKNLISEGEKQDSLAVILNDETLVFPLLNSIPKELERFNVTMGLPLKETSLYKLLDSVISLQENADRFARTGYRKLSFYHADLIRVLTHPFMHFIVPSADALVVKEQIQLSNRAFLTGLEVKNLIAENTENVPEILIRLTDPWENNIQQAVQFISALLHTLTERMLASEKKHQSGMELEYIFHFTKVVNKLEEIIKAVDFVQNLGTFRYLFNNLVKGIRIPFYGEPLQGAQVMGMLESRVLDFENIIMLSVNEDFIPAGKSDNSFIPFEVRRVFKLPTIRERNAVYAYHFYRLLQRSSNVYLLYNTEAGNLGGGERSRFLSQILHEMRAFSSNVEITEDILEMNIPEVSEEPDINIHKSVDIMQRLDELAVSGFSASSLNVYRNCSLQFYFNHILGLGEADQVEETIENATLGKVIHHVLQLLYEPLENKKLTAGELEVMKKRVPALVEKSFQENYAGGEVHFGKNLLIVKVAESYLFRFLDNEQQLVSDSEVVIKKMEQRLVSQVQLKSGKIIKIKGFIDRFDVTDGITRIIDYKTGKVEQKELNLKQWDDLQSADGFDKAFQLLFYSLLYQKTEKVSYIDFQAGIYSFRNLKEGLLAIRFPVNDWPESFESYLVELLGEIYDPVKQFTQTVDKDRCQYCTFKSVCNR